MAYHFTAEKRDNQNLLLLHEALEKFGLIEFFPIEISEPFVSLGVSIPFKSIGDPNFENELVTLMSYLVVEQGFEVTDLYTGNSVKADEISGLVKQISG